MNISKTFSWHMAHRLVGHKGLCKNIHGHTYKLQVTISAKQFDNMGMIMDFSDLKTLVNSTIVDTFDHALVLWDKDPFYPLLSNLPGMKIVTMKSQTTAENMVERMYDNLSAVLCLHCQAVITRKVKLVSLKLWETETSVAEYL